MEILMEIDPKKVDKCEEKLMRKRSLSRARSFRFNGWGGPSPEHAGLERRVSDPVQSDKIVDPKPKPSRAGRFRNKERRDVDRSKSLDRGILRNGPTNDFIPDGGGEKTPVIVNCSSVTTTTEPGNVAGSKISRWFDDVVDVFSDAESLSEKNEDAEVVDLKIKTLKDNIIRFSNVMDPLSTAAETFCRMKNWKNPFTTGIFLVVYIYAVIFGWFVSFLLGTFSVYLLTTYTSQLRPYSEPDLANSGNDGQREKSQKVTEKVVLILNIARKVQNALGSVCDSAEKIKNLLLWRHPASRSIFIISLSLLTISLFISSILILKVFGVYIALKLFLIDYLFQRFPKLRARYDTSSQLWDSLPTDSDLLKDKKEVNQSNGDANVRPFWQLFRLPPTEVPLDFWDNGIRCSLIGRDKSVTSAFKTGRLFITNSYLCFERSKTHREKNIVTPLAGIVRIEKGNQYPWIPGGGMIIEVTTRDPDKVYTFGAVLNRDEVFQEMEKVMEKGTRVSRRLNTPEKQSESQTITKIEETSKKND